MLPARDTARRRVVLLPVTGGTAVLRTTLVARIALVGTALLACIALVACRSGGAHLGTASPASPGASTTPAVASTASSTTTSLPVTSATRTAVVRAYRVFFASKSSVAQSQAALQHGEKFTTTLVAQGKTSYAAKTIATVQSVRQDAPNIAEVTFTIFTGGAPALSRVEGKAVLEGGRWKVAAQTFCQLLKLEGDAPAACDDATVTALTS